MRIAPILVFITSLALFLTGIFLGEPASLWQKAVALCMSCIGIG